MFCRVGSVSRVVTNSTFRPTTVNLTLRRRCSTDADEQFEDWLRLLKNNREWAQATKEKNPGYFDRLSAAQVCMKF